MKQMPEATEIEKQCTGYYDPNVVEDQPAKRSSIKSVPSLASNEDLSPEGRHSRKDRRF